ncbi:hypothetical protein U9M48_000609 [Paspalum notatum var. saurae]|uniref:Protein FAR1-RELATED SEQUENCE n=1 Tax=Paspalum notatum var. saurae TaxID=547442 RepID=A0AAQ3PH17_PASNO
MAKLLAFFTECRKQNPQFFCDFQLDDDGKIKSIFWSHASQQGEYADFGDAVMFDTKHKTNLYDKPLGMFVGANNHLRCTTFGFVLLGDETIETFEWAFNASKTYQDPAMPVALQRVFRNTIHRLRFENEDFKAKFQSIIHHPLTPNEFEAAWDMMLDEFSLRDDTTFKKFYELRKDWIPAFFKDDFCGVMVSTQRSESTNKVVKNCHVDANTPLHEFAKQMMKMIHEREMKEAAEALACNIYVDIYGQKKTNTLYSFEIRVARTYTRAVMNRFDESMKYSTAYKIVRDPDGGLDDCLVQHTSRSNKIVWGQHQFKVKADVDAEKYSCECKQWEHTDMIEKIPKEYVMQRYMTSAKVDVLFERKTGKCKVDDATAEEERGQRMAVQPNKEVSTADAGEAVVNKNSGQVSQPHDAIEARKRLSFAIEAISMEKPDRAKPKGRTIKDKKCGIADGHNSRTCMSLEENRVPPSSRNKSAISAAHWNETSTSKKLSVFDTGNAPRGVSRDVFGVAKSA